MKIVSRPPPNNLTLDEQSVELLTTALQRAYSIIDNVAVVDVTNGFYCMRFTEHAAAVEWLRTAILLLEEANE